MPPDDKAALTKALCALLDNPVRRTALGEAARARITADYSLESVATRLRALYDSVLAESSRCVPDA